MKVGDHLQLYHNRCSNARSSQTAAAEQICRKVFSGHGEVTEILSEDYSVVRFPPGTQFAEGDTLEKHRH